MIHMTPPRWYRLILILAVVAAMGLLVNDRVQASVPGSWNNLGEGNWSAISNPGTVLDVSIRSSLNSQNKLAIDWPKVGNWAWERAREFLTLLVFGLLAIWLFPKQFTRSVNRLQASPGKSTAIGLLAVVVGYFAAILLLLVVIGLFILFLVVEFQGLAWTFFTLGLSTWGVVLIGFSLIVSYISKLVVAYAIGKYLLDRLLPKAMKWYIWPLLLGMLVYVLVRSIPWLGCVFGVIATLMGLGAIWLAFRERRFTIIAQGEAAALPEQEEPLPEPVSVPREEEEIGEVVESTDDSA